MSEQADFSRFGFFKSIVLPALLMFLIPILSMLFFLHAQSQLNAEAREGMLAEARADQSLTAEEREQWIEAIERVPFSRMLLHPEFAEGVDSTTKYYFGTFRWMIRFSLICIATGVLVFLFGLVCLFFSYRSQKAQYISLSLGWHVLRICGALQTVLQGILVLALSYWVTALWMNMYVPKLIFFAGAIALAGVCMVLKAIFTPVKNEFEVEGDLIDRSQCEPLWDDLNQICKKVGTDPPDQLIVGIDDNFFATEQPIKVDGQDLKGRTVYASLSLLKELKGEEADAVMAHEMAHFSGQDTTYSTKISPLLQKYDIYLHGLYEGAITRPIFYFMMCFRSLFDLSLSKLSREREFRADRIAAEATSPDALAGALWRITAYSKYRHSIEEKLFEQEQALESANISEQIEEGFQRYACAFANESTGEGGQLQDMTTEHPFDSHPPMGKRLASIGVESTDSQVTAYLNDLGDGRWYSKITDAVEIEQKQWKEYEEKFRDFHENVLAYRLLPATNEERQVVEKYFPETTFEGKKINIVMDCDQLSAPLSWDEPVMWKDMSQLVLQENNVLEVHRSGATTLKIKLNSFPLQSKQQEVLEAIGNYYGRATAAIEYQKQKAEAAAESVEA